MTFSLGVNISKFLPQATKIFRRMLHTPELNYGLLKQISQNYNFSHVFRTNQLRFMIYHNVYRLLFTVFRVPFIIYLYYLPLFVLKNVSRPQFVTKTDRCQRKQSIRFKQIKHPKQLSTKTIKIRF